VTETKRAEGPESGAEELHGSWKLVSKERSGDKLEEVEEVVCTSEDDKFETKTAGKVTQSGAVRVDVTKSPRTYDVVITGDFNGKGMRTTGSTR